MNPEEAESAEDTKRRIDRAAGHLCWRLLCRGVEFRKHVQLGIYNMPVFIPEKLIVFEIDPGIMNDRARERNQHQRVSYLETAGLTVVSVYDDGIESLDLDEILLPRPGGDEVSVVRRRLAAWAGAAGVGRPSKKRAAAEKVAGKRERKFRRRSIAAPKKYRRAARCRDCGSREIVDTRDFMRATPPRCSSCGGLLQRGRLHPAV